MKTKNKYHPSKYPPGKYPDGQMSVGHPPGRYPRTVKRIAKFI